LEEDFAEFFFSPEKEAKGSTGINAMKLAEKSVGFGFRSHCHFSQPELLDIAAPCFDRACVQRCPRQETDGNASNQSFRVP
jgi:hypothetical protein